MLSLDDKKCYGRDVLRTILSLGPNNSRPAVCLNSFACNFKSVYGMYVDISCGFIDKCDVDFAGKLAFEEHIVHLEYLCCK